MDLSIIIVNYNVRQFLENALTSIFRALEGISGEVFVVDNASDDGSVEMVKSQFPAVCLIQNKENVGFSRANNIALKQARGQFLLLINPDTVVQEDTFHEMLRFFRETPDAGLAGCKILNPDGTFQLGAHRSFPTPWVAFTRIFGLSSLFPRSHVFGKYNLTYLSPDETYEVDAISGSFMMARREAYERIGGLDETYFMYGEDLDWCYRVGQTGFKVYYVHSTKIIHFKGESTRRSSLDEIAMFYDAMRVFVEKHFTESLFVELMLSCGIALRAAAAFVARAIRPFGLAAMDFVLIDIALLIAGYAYRGHPFVFPSYAYPAVYIAPALTTVLVMFLSGVYTTHRHSLLRVFTSVVIGYVLISSIVFFAKDFAFSRALVIIAGCVSMLLLPGWRVGVTVAGRVVARGTRRTGLFGTRTLIVGTGDSAQEVLRRLRARVESNYNVVGFIAPNRKQVGEKVAGLDVIGSLDNVGKVIGERRVGEVIFSMDGVSYADILSVIARSNDRSVNYRLVPNSLEAIIGKTRIDQLDSLPLVDIEYNLHKTGHRILKRLSDVIGSGLLLVVAYPWAWIRMRVVAPEVPGIVASRTLLLPQVFSGTLSFVGRPLSDPDQEGGNPTYAGNRGSYLGPKGLTGLVQINARGDLDAEEIERYKLYYAKNHSFGLDLEIILKSLLLLWKK